MKQFIIISLEIVILVTGLILSLNGFIWPTYWFVWQYPVQGIDVSHHQKTIDWLQVAKSPKVRFVFIKATEGKNFQDPNFWINWEGASKAGILKGAYHYFTITSSGAEQARNFIAVVPRENIGLPPVIDIEEKGLSKAAFRQELHQFIETVERHYKQRPLLYVIYDLYDEYIKGDFQEYPIWIRDIIKPPQLSDKHTWMFWQFGDRGRIPGIATFVDLNAFCGDEQYLRNWILDSYIK